MTISEFRNQSKKNNSMSVSEIDNLVSCSTYKGGAHNLSVCVMEKDTQKVKNVTQESYSYNFLGDDDYVRVPRLENRDSAYKFLLKLYK